MCAPPDSISDELCSIPCQTFWQWWSPNHVSMSRHFPSLGASQQSAFAYLSIDPCSLVVEGVPPHQRHHQIPSSTQTGMTKYDLFSMSSFNCNFGQSNNQTFNVYMESTLSIYRKGLCTFFQFRNLPLKIFDVN